MATINRFVNNAPVARFSPMSMQEMAYAPSILREREDEMLNTIDELSNLMYNVQVPDQYKDMLASEREAFTGELDKLANTIRESGSGDLTHFNDLRRLRNRYNKNISASGAIGKAARLHEQEKIARQQFMEAGFQTGWANDPEALQRNYEEQLASYMNSLKNTDLSKPGEVPEFNPNFAPAFMSLDNEMLKLRSLVGQVGKAIPPDSKLIPNGNGGFAIQTVGGKTITNEPNLDALNKYLRNQALDPDSQLAKNLKMRGTTPEEFIENANLFTQISLIEDTNLSSRVTGAGGSGGRNNKKTSEDSGASLIDVESGTPYVSYTGEPVTTLNDADRELAAIEEAYNTQQISTEEYDRNRDHMNLVKRARQTYEDSDEYQELLTNEINNNANAIQLTEVLDAKGIDPLGVDIFGAQAGAALQQLTSYLGMDTSSGGMLKKYGITSKEEYTKFMNSPEAQDVLIGKEAGPQVGAIPGNPLATAFNRMDLGITKGELVERAWEDINRNISNPMTQGKDFKVLNIDPKSQKFGKDFGQGMSMNFDMVDAVLKGAIDYKGQNDKDWVLGKELRNNWENSELREFINGAESVDYRLKGLDMGTMSQEPAVQLELSGKVGDEVQKYTVMRRLKSNDDFAKALLSEEGHFYKELNPEGQQIFRVMKANIDYNKVPLSLTPEEGFNPRRSNTVRAQVLRRDQEKDRAFGRVSKSKNDRRHKEKFFNPYDNSYDFAVMINPDLSYTPTRRNKDTGSTEQLTFKDYFREELEGTPSSARPEGIAQLAFLLEQSTLNIDDPADNAIVFSGDEKYQAALNNFYEKTRGLDITDKNYQAAAVNFYNDIENMRVHFRSIKEAL